MSPLHRPRLVARLIGGLLVLVAAWVTLVPVTAVYVADFVNPFPTHVTRVYSWWTSDQRIVYSDATGFDLTQISFADLGQRVELRAGYRLGCGNAFGHGVHEEAVAPAGPVVCSGVRKPRRIIGLSLLGIGLVGLVASFKLPARAGDTPDRYRQPRSQRRALKRGR